MTPLTVNPTVRVWREASTGNIIRIDTNVAPDLKVEVVNIKDGECIADLDPLIEGNYPFGALPVFPTYRK